MKLSSRSLTSSGRIAGRCAFAVQAPFGHVRLGHNRNPHLAWAGAPATTRSFALTMIDGDAPTRPDDVNREGRVVPAALPRAEFVHWLLADMPAAVTEIAEGSCCDCVTAHGKAQPRGPEGTVQGVNDYSGWFKGDAAMEGTYLGYDGPCPPWNDALTHRYRFEVLALDLDSCGLKSGFSVSELRQVVDGHVLARGSLVGRYSLNPAIQLR
ncbi:YbhB/YbcL family Raf kinase inhibitor-like protein [Solimonas terrae]|uniref:YbhB/YbcL family Raf kinase inhibitor-like protein n=1 Tax=Solimonas terrae TaxID=1396819 RepID=A0A6M2BSR5_9GAMM|nr:YbhB/YbcL family Raf kinase inhibitor-like protein [Solimonas terrae]NGY05370.1 YbhB/YbcL family Raf kinase inhibitor-like protein [Solimonas terrae]